MHELGVKRFFDVHGNMGIRLENVDGHEWPKRAAITINELRDALTSKMKDQQNYFKEFYVRKMIKEVLEEEKLNKELSEVMNKKEHEKKEMKKLDNLIDKILVRVAERVQENSILK